MLTNKPLPALLATVTTLLVIAIISGCTDSTAADAKQAEYQIPNSDIRLTMTIQANEKERIVQASDGDEPLFKTKLGTPADGKPRARLYKNKEDYTLVDANGDHYLLNMREKRFDKSTDSSPAASTKYVGKFDFDKKHHWRFIPSKQMARADDASSATATAASDSSSRQFGPPSKQFR
jgi:hypothetical protein